MVLRRQFGPVPNEWPLAYLWSSDMRCSRSLMNKSSPTEKCPQPSVISDPLELGEEGEFLSLSRLYNEERPRAEVVVMTSSSAGFASPEMMPLAPAYFSRKAAPISQAVARHATSLLP